MVLELVVDVVAVDASDGQSEKSLQCTDAELDDFVEGSLAILEA